MVHTIVQMFATVSQGGAGTKYLKSLKEDKSHYFGDWFASTPSDMWNELCGKQRFSVETISHWRPDHAIQAK